jgi:hypothetical protein
MYGPDYLEWREQEDAREKFGEFLAGLDADERAVMEGVLRQRYKVVTESALSSIFNARAANCCRYPSQSDLLRGMPVQGVGVGGGIFGNLF